MPENAQLPDLGQEGEADIPQQPKQRAPLKESTNNDNNMFTPKGSPASADKSPGGAGAPNRNGRFDGDYTQGVLWYDYCQTTRW